ncbi:tail fiber [Salmonella phage PC79-13]|uniref:Tail fiber n=1 Tax=Salmonella phage PC79-13 TaxID=3092642 RepID=A0ABZ0Z5T6_9CAUD|nr:tail fiber [Salmonella phage PC79-13]
MAVGEIQISALPQASLPIELSDIFHLKQGIEDKRCTLEQLLDPHASLRNNPHGVTKVQVELGNVLNALQLVAANNLSDIVDVAEARANLQIMSSDEVNQLIQAHINDKNNPHNTTKSQVGLGNVQNWLASNAYNEDADKYATARAVNSLYRAVQASYPVGTIHLSMNSANPSTYLICGGTWELVSRGRALVGYDSASRPAGSTFGSQTTALTANNIPAHTHSVYVTGGGHSHGATASISSFDYGNKSTTTFDYGTKTTSSFNYGNKTTSSAGFTQTTWINRGYDPGSHPGLSVVGADYDPRATLTTANNHTHTVAIGAHTHTVAIGSHSHSVSIGSHSHTATVNVTGAGEHSHSGTTGSTGSGQAFNIEQPSFVLYVWQRTA